MTWEIEVLAVRTADLALAVPDVMAPTRKTQRFPAAASRVLSKHVPAAIAGEWAIALDVDCRLSSDTFHLTESSRSTDLHLVRISADPIVLDWRDGRPVTEARGRDAVLSLVPREDGDAELSATEALEQRTGLRFPIDLWSTAFTVFKVA